MPRVLVLALITQMALVPHMLSHAAGIATTSPSDTASIASNVYGMISAHATARDALPLQRPSAAAGMDAELPDHTRRRSRRDSTSALNLSECAVDDDCSLHSEFCSINP